MKVYERNDRFEVVFFDRYDSQPYEINKWAEKGFRAFLAEVDGQYVPVKVEYDKTRHSLNDILEYAKRIQNCPICKSINENIAMLEEIHLQNPPSSPRPPTPPSPSPSPTTPATPTTPTTPTPSAPQTPQSQTSQFYEMLGRQMLQKLPSEFRILFSLLTNDASMLPQNDDLIKGIANILTGNISVPTENENEKKKKEQKQKQKKEGKRLKPSRRIY